MVIPAPGRTKGAADERQGLVAHPDHAVLRCRGDLRGAVYLSDHHGSHVRRLTLARVPDHAYTAIDWSRDGRYLLVDRRIFLDPSLTITSHALRFIDVDTGGVIPLTGGQAEPGAWFQR